MSKQRRILDKKREYQQKQLAGKKFMSLDEYREFYDRGKVKKIILSDIDMNFPISIDDNNDSKM